MTDWESLCAFESPSPDEAGAGNHQVGGGYAGSVQVVTTQTTDSKDENGLCNHVTTVTPENKRGGKQAAFQPYPTCHKSESIESDRIEHGRGVSGDGYETCHKSSEGEGEWYGVRQARQPSLRELPAHPVEWYQASTGEGWDCRFCTHLVSRHEYHEHIRRRFFWRCELGHAVMEYGCESERILLAPADCHDWERFVPGPRQKATAR